MEYQYRHECGRGVGRHVRDDRRQQPAPEREQVQDDHRDRDRHDTEEPEDEVPGVRHERQGKVPGRGAVPRPASTQPEASAVTSDFVSAGTAVPLRTTLSAWVSAASAKTS